MLKMVTWTDYLIWFRTWNLAWMHELQWCLQWKLVTAAPTPNTSSDHSTTSFPSKSCFLWQDLSHFGCSSCFFWRKTPETQWSPVHAPVPAARRTALWIKPPEHRWWRVDTFCSPEKNSATALCCLPLAWFSIYISEAGRTFSLSSN